MAELEALQLLRTLDEDVAAKTGISFFEHLVVSLAKALNATCAFASEIEAESYKAYALAYWHHGALGEVFEYALSGTPCECVLDNQIVAFPRNIQQMFPKDQEWFAGLDAQSFLAIPLCDERGQVRGHLAVLDSRERDWNEADFEILRIFSRRAGTELERREHQKRLETMNLALQKANAQLRQEITQRLAAETRLASTNARAQHTAELVRIINSGITPKTGTEFFEELVRSLAQALNAHIVFVAQLDSACYEADVLAIWLGKSFGEPYRFNLSATPCESILDGQIAAFPRQVAELFPAARPILEKLGTQSFLAIPIVDEDTTVIGHIAVQDHRERDWGETEFGLLRLFANRAAAELKRRGHEKRLEDTNAQLQRANAELRREVATRLQMEKQLEKATKAAEEANRAKSHFLAHMSHELRTPLNGILGYAQLLRRDQDLTQEQHHSVAVIEHSGEHLLTLINDLLDLAKIEAGRLDLQTDAFDVPQLLKHVVDLATVRAAHTGIAFTYHVAPELPARVNGDERAVRQILLNLLGNAMKFTNAGEVQFRVTGTRSSVTNCELQFEIRDTGPGIAQQDLTRIFEPFERVEGPVRIEGTGLGLSITNRLVRAMAGKIAVSSEVGTGSTFTITLPFVTDDGAEVPGVPERRIAGYSGHRRRALLVDDDEASRHLISRILGDVGFELVEAGNVTDALMSLRSPRLPDLNITDLAMPDNSGIDLARMVRADASLRRLPIVAVSASASTFTREEALAAGCDDFLAKPLRAEHLLSTVGQLLRLSWQMIDVPVTAAEVVSVYRPTEGMALDEARATELYDLAMKGDIQELIARADSACAGDPDCAALYQEVQRLARRFDFKGIRRVLDQARENAI